MSASEILRAIDDVLDKGPPEELRVLARGLPGRYREARRRLDSRATIGVSSGGDRLLTAKQVQHLAGVSTRWLYEHADRLPFTRRLGPDVVRFSERVLRQWIESRRG